MEHKPLKEIRILELGGYISAPYATSLLGALGAEVVKVERPVGGDDFRRQDNDRSPYFIQYNAGKRSLGVDLKKSEGVALVKALIPRFDVVMENMRPGKLAAMGLGQADCAALRPDLVYASISGFGSGGPLEQRPAYDTIGQAFGGMYSVLSDAGSAQLAGTPIGDLITGVAAAAGVLAGLVGRAAMTQYFDDGGRDPSRQSRHPQAQNFCLKTATGEDIAIHLSSSQKFWLSFLQALDRRDLADDPRFTTYNLRVANYFELVEIVEPEFAKKPASEWEERLMAADVPFAPVLTMSGYITHPQTRWLELLEPDRDGLQLLRPPWRFGGTRPERPGLAPKVGQDTREIAAEVYDQSRIEELIAAGILFAHS